MESARFCNFCRLCLCSGKDLLDVFDANKHGGLGLIGMIQDLIRLKVIRDDMQKWMICQSCMCQLHVFQRFKDRCMRNKLIIDGMFQLGSDGAITAPSTKYKMIEPEKLRFKDGGKKQLERGLPKVASVTGDEDFPNHFHGVQVPSPAGSVINSLLEEGNDDGADTVIEFCWCWDCGDEFLSKQELVVHSSWCRGRGKLVPNSTDEDFCQDEMKVDNFLGKINRPLVNPNVCCGRCRKVFKKRENLIRHINKYDFKCKPKDSPGSPTMPKTAVSVDENEVLFLSLAHYKKSDEQNVHYKKNEDKYGVSKFPMDLLEQNQLKYLNVENGSISKEMAVLNTKSSKCEYHVNKTICRPTDEVLTLEIQNMSSSQQIAQLSPPIDSKIFCTKCGMVFESEPCMTLHLTNCRLGLSNEGFNAINGRDDLQHLTRMSSSVLECEMVGELQSSIVSCGNKASGGSCESKDVLSQASSVFLDERLMSVDKSLKLDGENMLFFCDYCEKSHTNKPYLRNHIVKCHLSLHPEKCAVCHRLFTNSEELDEHSRLHPKDKKFFCTVCEESFCTRLILKKHIRDTHGVRKSYVCSLCSNGFTSMSDVGLHISLVHTDSEKPFKCIKCGKSYADKRKFNFHVNVCQLTRVLFRCHICGKHLTSQSNLRNHILFHSDERKFSCPMCPQRFRLSGHKSIHIRSVHLKVKPFECGICNKRFGSKPSLNHHYISHSDARPFVCSECPKSFKTKSALKKHLFNMHAAS